MKIGFKNLRSLKDTGLVELKPLTFLLGQNSSGKSTFLRSLPLLRQSVETRTKGPILWYGTFVDFGDFTTALNDKSEEKIIQFNFEIDLEGTLDSRRYMRRFDSLWNKIANLRNCNISLTIKSEKEFATVTSAIKISFNGFSIDIILDAEQNAKISVDGKPTGIENVKAFQMGNGLLPQLIVKTKERFMVADYNFQVKKTFDLIREISQKNYSDQTVQRILNGFNFDSDVSLFESLLSSKEGVAFKKNIAKVGFNSVEFEKVKLTVLPVFLPLLLEGVDSHLTEVFKSVYYIAPVRAIAERYYRPQELNIDEVDFQGKNLALVLANLSDAEKNRFKDWCLSNFEFYPEASLRGGNISIYVNFKNDTSKHNITDLGFGFSQILPIITQIWTTILKGHKSRVARHRERIFVIEQPELHLHPKIQGKLVDALINVVEYCEKLEVKVRFVIETHSETIINAVGNRIYSKKIAPTAVNVLLFDRIKNVTEVKSVGYDADGSLIDWPYGFFDEEYI